MGALNADGRLPVPSLDDRRYSDLVDQAMRLRAQLCPEWTSTEPGDPGVALIEIFAFLTDQLIYRLNQVPDRLYSTFLNMVGVRGRPAGLASTTIDFVLAAPNEQPLHIPAGTCVATVRTGDAAAVEFRTVATGVAPVGRLAADVTRTGEWSHLPFTGGGPNAVVLVKFADNPDAELDWEFSTPDGWSAAGTRESLVHTGPGWDGRQLRFRAVSGDVPQVREAHCVGVSVLAEHGTSVIGEELGTGTGRPRQRLRTRRAPLVPGEHRVRVSGAEWVAVDSLVDSFGDDRHYEIDRNTGEVLFGDGTHGAVPAPGEQITIDYVAGGGTAGNVAAGTIAVLNTAVPFVTQVTNRFPALGGIDPEPVEEVRAKAPALLRSGWRAVSAADFERLALEATPVVARARCLTDDRGDARVLVVPSVRVEDDFTDLLIANPVFEAVGSYLEDRRTAGARLVLEPPSYRGVIVSATVTRAGHDPVDRLRSRAAEAVRTYLHPVAGGRDGRGWPFGRSLVAGELFGVLLDVAGVGLVDEVRLSGWDPITGNRDREADRIDLPPDALLWPGPPEIRFR
ncbi:putative baseplate assembly protein [Lentzea sp. NPDC004782]|uniref:putative baseplate assembly protein n=1 Tax=Lentzea sp. NPDC004782 TaxID=3154458 RepID=UPI0033B5EEF9